MEDRTFPVLEEAYEYFEKAKTVNFKYIPIPANQLVPLGIGNMVGENELHELRHSIITTAEKYGFPQTKSGDMAELDKLLGKTIYEKMRITPSVAATIPMWHFINLCLVPDYVFWRFGAVKDHFLSDRRNYFGTQWWRYYLFCIYSDGSSEYSKMTDRNIADLYERHNSCGYPNHMIDIYQWFKDLYLNNFEKKTKKLNRDNLFRKTIKIYGSKLSYRFYFSLDENEKRKIFEESFYEAMILIEKEELQSKLSPSVKRKRVVVVRKT